MMTRLFSWAKRASVAVGFIAVFVFANVANAGQVPGPLVDVAWLKANTDDVVVLDVRANPDTFTEKGHIPGAVLVPWSQVRGEKTVDGVDLIKMVPSAVTFARLMKVSGVNADSAVVVTVDGLSSSDVFYGTRLYWQLKYFGHDNVAMLDGGNAAWAAAKLPMSNDESAPSVGNWTAGAEREELLATTAEIAEMVANGSSDLVDGRTLDYHLGLEQKSDYVYAAGHIPGSSMVPHDLLVAHDGPKTFRTPEEIEALVTAMGVDLSAPNAAYCNSGHLGSGLWFALYELAGNKDAVLYDGSMHAWTKDTARPVTAMNLN